MTIVAVFVSDRRDLYLPDCLASFDKNVGSDFISHVVDDSSHELGMAGAVRAGFQWAIDQQCDYVLWTEEDFQYLEPPPLAEMQWILERNPHLAQVVLKRPAWSSAEKAAGGIVELHPDDYTECKAWGRNVAWTEHSRIFSLNPTLIPRRVLELGWPDGNEAEFTQRCLAEGYRFAFYGAKYGPPLVEHVGAVRGAGWRL